MLIENDVVYLQIVMSRSIYLPLEFIVRIIYMCITYFNTLMHVKPSKPRRV